MYSNRREIEPFPFKGVIYVDEQEDGDDLMSSGDVTRKVIMEINCDIQESNKLFTQGAITASFNILFPFDKDIPLKVTRGMMFESDMYGMQVNGIIVGVAPTQKGFCTIYIRDTDV